MRINLNITLKGLDGRPLHLSDAAGNVDKDPATLRKVFTNVVVGEHPELDRTVDGTEKLRRYQLAVRMADTDDIVLEQADVTMIRDRLPKFYGPMVSGQAWLVLEQITK